ncbi:serine/threonine-protein kinase [Gimesia fumaroli]|uniref:Serine/threonine-protein kinase PknD n=1 Tax=Gimesia fumaroli TaxID=2527976 RepID=A0A518IFV6_9PLAN|nr:serine/threonine-protein kinase [Gimesia fumaroli]QDV51977.1 Serine/threonine-protein kinase PknD [Gimesia fumaroli]
MTNHDSTKPGHLAELEKQYQDLLNNNFLQWNNRRTFSRCLGVGGQGVVYLSAREGADGFNIPVALKLFSPKRYDNARAYQTEMGRLSQVAARVARVQENHLVAVQNFVRRKQIYIMEMEWVDGYDLRSLLTPATFKQIREQVTLRRWKNINNNVFTKGVQQPRLKPGIAVAILRECLAALAALHRNDIIHCDMKPANIMLKRSGNAKIIDIGSAIDLNNLPSNQPCTPTYAAPEVLSGERATPQSDLASLGYILIEVITGFQPFANLKYAQLIKAKQNILQQLPQWFPDEEFALSEPLMKLIHRLVHPNPAERFASAEAADLGEDGAAEFHRLLVKSDLPSDYENELRLWIEEVETDYFDEGQFTADPDTTVFTTRAWQDQDLDELSAES